MRMYRSRSASVCIGADLQCVCIGADLQCVCIGVQTLNYFRQDIRNRFLKIFVYIFTKKIAFGFF